MLVAIHDVERANERQRRSELTLVRVRKNSRTKIEWGSTRADWLDRLQLLIRTRVEQERETPHPRPHQAHITIISLVSSQLYSPDLQDRRLSNVDLFDLLATSATTKADDRRPLFREVSLWLPHSEQDARCHLPHRNRYRTRGDGQAAVTRSQLVRVGPRDRSLLLGRISRALNLVSDLSSTPETTP